MAVYCASCPLQPHRSNKHNSKLHHISVSYTTILTSFMRLITEIWLLNLILLFYYKLISPILKYLVSDDFCTKHTTWISGLRFAQLSALRYWSFQLWHCILLLRGAQIWGTRFPTVLNFLQWCLIFVGPQYGVCFTPSFWHLGFFKWILDF